MNDKPKLQYFGTNLTNHGHYFWEVGENYLHSSNLNFDSFNFNPCNMPEYEIGETRNKGDVKFYHKSPFVICAIEGSCIDKRSGTNSVFFIKGEFSYNNLMLAMRESKPVQEIINSFPFELFCKMPFELKIKK